MRIGLATSPKPFTDERGVVRIDGRQLDVVDLETGELVNNVAGMMWGPGKILMDPSSEGIFTPEHFDRDRDYLIVVVECPHAVSVPTQETRTK